MKKILAYATSLILLVSLLLPAALFGSAQSNSLYDRILERDGFIYGVNMPWVTPKDEGCTWAANTLLSKPSGFDAAALEAVMRDMSAVGFNGVRVQLFDQLQGLTFDKRGLLTGVSQELLDHLKTLLKLADELKLPLAFVLLPGVGSSADAMSKTVYDGVSQILTDSPYRKTYLEQVVAPVCRLFAQYPEVVLAVDVMSEPDGELYQVGDTCGTSWSVVRDFISASAAAVKEYLPGVPVMASSRAAAQASVKTGQLNTLGLDIVGVTEYNDTGAIPSSRELRAFTPAWITEMGTLDPEITEEIHTLTTRKFYDNARQNGYRAAFYGRYGSKDVTDGVSLIDASGRLKPAATALHFTLLDNANKRAGTDAADVPALMHIATASDIRWMGSRYAESYTIERSTDGKNWVKAAESIDVQAVDPNSNHQCSYSDDKAAVNSYYVYRVTATLIDGTRTTSQISPPVFVPKMTCSPEENLYPGDSGFEKGVLGSEWSYDEGDDDLWESGVQKGAVAAGTTHSGDYAYKLTSGGLWKQMYALIPKGTVLKPGTKYTFTMYYKVDKAFADGGTPWVGLMRVNASPWGWYHPASNVENEYMVMNPDGEWHAYTYTFTARDDDYIFAVRNAHYGEMYIDDIYLFEAPPIPDAPTTARTAVYNAGRAAGSAALTGDGESRNLFANGGLENGHLSDVYEGGENKIYPAAQLDYSGSYGDGNVVSAASEPENVHAGRYALKFTSTGGWAGRMGYYLDNLEPNTCYTFSYWYKVTDYAMGDFKSGPTFGMANWDSFWGTYYTMPGWNSTASEDNDWKWPEYELDGEWHQAVGTFYTGDSAKYVFTLWDDGNPWTAYIDELSLMKTGNLFANGGLENGHLSDVYEGGENKIYPAAQLDYSGSYGDGNVVSAASEPENVHAGRYALKFTSTGGWAGRMGYYLDNLQPHTNYTYSYWYKVTDYAMGDFKSGPTFGMANWDSFWGTYYSMPGWNSTASEDNDWKWPEYKLDGEWHQAYGTFNTGDQTKFVFTLWDDGNPWTAYIDDLSLTLSENLLNNGNFETGHLSDGYAEDNELKNYPDAQFDYTNAALYGDAKNIVCAEDEPENVRSGRYALKFSSTGSWSTRMGYYLDDLQPNTTYTYSYWYKVTDFTMGDFKEGPTFGMANWDSFWGTYYSLPGWNSTADNWGWPEYKLDGEWHQAVGSFNTGDQTKFVFTLWDDGNPWTAYIDDITLAPAAAGRVPEEDEMVVTAVVTDFLHTKLSVSSPDKNRLSGDNTSAVLNSQDTLWTLDVELEPDTDYMFSAWVKGTSYGEGQTGAARFGVGVPSTNTFLFTPPVLDDDGSLLAAPYAAALAAPCWDGQWYRRGLTFNSGNLETVRLLITGTDSCLELKNMVLCKASDAAADPVVTEKITPITDISETPDRMYDCNAADNLLASANFAAGEGYGAAYTGSAAAMTQTANGLGTTFLCWVDVQPNTAYTFRAYAMGEGEGCASFGLLTRGTSGLDAVGRDQIVSYGGDWPVYTFRFNSGEHTRIAFTAFNGGGQVQLRDAALFETSKALQHPEDPVDPAPEPVNPGTGVGLAAGAPILVVLSAATGLLTWKRRRGRCA